MTPKLGEAADVNLNADQARACELVSELLQGGDGGQLLLKGPAGTGKTVVAWRILYDLVHSGVISGTCAASWEAARLLPCTMSFHEVFGLRPGGEPKITPERAAYLE